MLLVGLNLRGGIAAVASVLPEVRADLGISAATAGLLTSLPVLCFALGAPLSAWLGHMMGPSHAVLLSCLAIACVTVVRPYGDIRVLLVGTLALGLAMTLGNVLLPVIVKRDFGPFSGQASGVVTASLAAGAALTAALTAPLAGWLGWRHALAFWSLMALLTTVVWWGVVPARETAAARVAAPARAAARLRSDGVAWALTAYLGLQSFCYYALTAWLPSLLQETAGLSRADAGLAVSIFQLLGVPGALLVPFALNLGRDQRTLGVGIALGWMLTVLGLVAAPSLWLAISVLGGVVQGMGISFAFSVLVVRSADDRAAGRLSAMMQLFGYPLGAAGPLLVGLVQEQSHSWTAAMLVVAAAAAGLGVAGSQAGRARTVHA